MKDRISGITARLSKKMMVVAAAATLALVTTVGLVAAAGPGCGDEIDDDMARAAPTRAVEVAQQSTLQPDDSFAAALAERLGTETGDVTRSLLDARASIPRKPGGRWS